MPIDIDQFKSGKSSESFIQVVKEFLQNHRDKAYLATELFEVMKGRKLVSPADLFEIQNVLHILSRERSIVSRHVETKDGFQAFYSFNEGWAHIFYLVIESKGTSYIFFLWPYISWWSSTSDMNRKTDLHSAQQWILSRCSAETDFSIVSRWICYISIAWWMKLEDISVWHIRYIIM